MNGRSNMVCCMAAALYLLVTRQVAAVKPSLYSLHPTDYFVQRLGSIPTNQQRAIVSTYIGLRELGAVDIIGHLSAAMRTRPSCASAARRAVHGKL